MFQQKTAYFNKSVDSDIVKIWKGEGGKVVKDPLEAEYVVVDKWDKALLKLKQHGQLSHVFRSMWVLDTVDSEHGRIPMGKYILQPPELDELVNNPLRPTFAGPPPIDPGARKRLKLILDNGDVKPLYPPKPRLSRSKAALAARERGTYVPRVGENVPTVPGTDTPLDGQALDFVQGDLPLDDVPVLKLGKRNNISFRLFTVGTHGYRAVKNGKVLGENKNANDENTSSNSDTQAPARAKRSDAKKKTSSKSAPPVTQPATQSPPKRSRKHVEEEPSSRKPKKKKKRRRRDIPLTPKYPEATGRSSQGKGKGKFTLDPEVEGMTMTDLIFRMNGNKELAQLVLSGSVSLSSVRESYWNEDDDEVLRHWTIGEGATNNVRESAKNAATVLDRSEAEIQTRMAWLSIDAE